MRRKNKPPVEPEGAKVEGNGAESVFIRIPEAMKIMECSRSTAQRCFAAINDRLRKKGLFVIAGRCNRRAFYEAIGKEG